MPHLTLFVDDNVQNIKRASEAGLRTIHFTGIEDFKAQLEKDFNLKMLRCSG